MTMASPALSTGSQTMSPNLFERYQHELRQANGTSPADHSPVSHHSPVQSPPPAANGDSNITRHHLEAAIPESPVEEARSEEQTVDRPVSRSRPGSYQQPSLLSHGAPSARARTPSSAGSHHADSSASVAPKQKKGLLRKLSGLNIFHHESKHHAGSSADLKAAQAGMHNTELKHPHTGATSKPTDVVPISPTARRTQRPSFAFGDSPGETPNTSSRPSRAPSVDAFSTSNHENMMLGVSPSKGNAGPPQSSGSSLSNGSPLRDHDDFVPRQPTRANSTFNFFKKNTSIPSHSPPTRAASFHHGETRPVTIPGVKKEPSSDTPMADLSRTLSKASLVGGNGWGNITDRLPSFDTLYTYKDANEKKIKLDMHGKLGQIGEGAGGVIRTARLKPGKRPAYNPSSTGGNLGLFAVKTFRKQNERESEGWYCQKLVREFRVHCALSHDNIVKLADICVEQKKFGESSFVAVLDFCVGGDVFNLHYHAWNAIDQGVMSKVERNCVFKQLMFAVVYMHQQGIAHRDIKLENMLVDGHGQVKLADFGTSNFTRGADAEPCRGYVGTEHSMAPESFLSDLSSHKEKPEYDGMKADIWACAVTWHILTWSNDEPMAVLRAYPFGEDGASPDNKQWQKYMNSIKRYEPDRYIPGWDLYMERKAEKNHSGTPPATPTIDRKSSIALSAASGTSGPSMMDQMFDTTDPNPTAHTHPELNDLKDPLRKCKPFVNGYPGSGFTAAKGMLDPDPDRRWTAQQVIDDPFFALIECCQKDSNPSGYDSSREKTRKGLQKVHNHIRPAARKMMEMNKVEQARNEEKTAAIRGHRD
ncbi:Serine/threonine-protein kinase hal4 [Taphrina deformans PYCC 5710]|uniref:Serine/threonine-protein kinase hal4 n=1 Tax=Taphrina deformans (strain PYCC 5710 / ATCC 11124 / CBS 356.35 / IMI 108563 / JCM 9778 / NBRC 8474) TaxID=1097556 RepID=R4ZYJ5_TAPDE|nr:Serine/threonine-protein kinase hal4 [Taphrina deformans PYCC 5710]|eukprot:CCX35406.1 Serine/threonine-protein kinase hal4 [Taphrina deformans PYCC 5710]